MVEALVIVESPAKCKKIEGFLRGVCSVRCVATYGHMRHIKSLDDIVYRACEPDAASPGRLPEPHLVFHEMPEKKRNIDALRASIREAGAVYLATDGDREGEAIAWHVCDMFGLPVEGTPRMVFSEITETAIRAAFVEAPNVTVNMPLVRAQMARQVLDMWIGFHVSPFLWKNVRGAAKGGARHVGLSAGRCQTPALRLVYENDAEVRESWGTCAYAYETTGYFGRTNVRFRLDRDFGSETDVETFLEGSVTHSHVFRRVRHAQTRHAAPEPFTTSRLQQASSNVLRLSPKATMQHAQTLYEHGYITYMRTDSQRYSPEFLKAVQAHVKNEWGEAHFNHDAGADADADAYTKRCCHLDLASLGATEGARHERKGSASSEGAAAHEAIRPTDVERRTVRPSEAAPLCAKARRLYELIHSNAVESCMADARGEALHVTLSAPRVAPVAPTAENGGCKDAPPAYVSSAERLLFKGWMNVRTSATSSRTVEAVEADTHPSAALGPEGADASTYAYFDSLKDGDVLHYNRVDARVRLSGVRSRYTEARVVRLLETHGIGRPSTYAGLLEKLHDRQYVETGDVPGVSREVGDYRLERGQFASAGARAGAGAERVNRVHTFGEEKGKVILRPTGARVMSYLDGTPFSELFSYDFTGRMEGSLDDVARGVIGWAEVCAEYHATLHRLVDATCANAAALSREEPSPSPSPSSSPSPSGASGGERRQLTDHIGVRRGKWGAYVYYKKPNMTKPTFINIKRFGGDPWTCEASSLLAWMREKRLLI